MARQAHPCAVRASASEHYQEVPEHENTEEPELHHVPEDELNPRAAAHNALHAASQRLRGLCDLHELEQLAVAAWMASGGKRSQRCERRSLHTAYHRAFGAVEKRLAEIAKLHPPTPRTPPQLHPAVEGAALSSYEQARQRSIAQNQQVLASLGL